MYRVLSEEKEGSWPSPHLLSLTYKMLRHPSSFRAALLLLLVGGPVFVWFVHWFSSLGKPIDEAMFWATFVLGSLLGAASTHVGRGASVASRAWTLGLFFLFAGPIFLWIVSWPERVENPRPMFLALVLGSVWSTVLVCGFNKCPKCGKLNAMRREGNFFISLLSDIVPPRPQRVKFTCQHCGFEEWTEVDEST
jgi:hypothetical protein